MLCSPQVIRPLPAHYIQAHRDTLQRGHLTPGSISEQRLRHAPRQAPRHHTVTSMRRHQCQIHIRLTRRCNLVSASDHQQPIRILVWLFPHLLVHKRLPGTSHLRTTPVTFQERGKTGRLVSGTISVRRQLLVSQAPRSPIRTNNEFLP